MYYGRKKGIIIAIVVVAVILVLGVAGTCVYMFTDLFKSNQDLFWKYMGKVVEDTQTSENTQLSEIAKLQEQSPYVVNGELTANYDGKNTKISGALEKAKITVDSEVDKANDYAYVNLKMDYADNSLFDIKYVQDDDVYALKSDEIVSAYIGVRNKNLKVLAQKLLGSGVDTSAIPDSIEAASYADLLSLSEEEKTNILNTYATVIKDSINQNNYSKQTEAVIEKDGVQYKTTSYRVDLSQAEVSSIIVKVLETLKTDNMTLNIISTKMQEMGIAEDEASITNITDQIDSLIDDVTETEFTDTAFVVYAYKGQAIATEVILRNTAKITLYTTNLNNQQKVTAKVENLSDTDDYKVITVDMSAQNTSTTSTITVKVNCDGQEGYLNIQNTGSATQKSLNTDVELSATIDDETATLNYNQTMEFVPSLENVEQLDNTNCAILNDYPTDDLNNLIQALMQQIIVVYANKAQTLGM